MIRLPLKKGCFKINVARSQLLLAAIWQLIRNPGLVGSRRIGLLVILLLVLETSEYQFGLCPVQFPRIVRTCHSVGTTRSHEAGWY